MPIGTIKTSTPQERAAEGTTPVNLPTGLVAGELMVLFGSVMNATTITNPTGWTVIANASNNTNTQTPNFYLGWKVATAGDVTAGTVSVTHTVNVSIWGTLSVPGVSAAVLDAVGTLYDSAGSGVSTVVLPGLSTSQAGTLLIYAAANLSTVATATPPSSPAAFTEVVDLSTGTRAGTMGYLLWSGDGATGNVSVVFSGTGRSVGILAALQPAFVDAAGYVNLGKPNQTLTLGSAGALNLSSLARGVRSGTPGQTLSLASSTADRPTYVRGGKPNQTLTLGTTGALVLASLARGARAGNPFNSIILESIINQAAEEPEDAGRTRVMTLDEAYDAVLSPTTRITRRIEIYESDGATPWLPTANTPRLISGSVSVDYSRDERRNIDVILDNADGVLQHHPEGFWYDKVIKAYRGLEVTLPFHPPRILVIEDVGNAGRAGFRSLMSGIKYTDVTNKLDATVLEDLQGYDIIVSLGNTGTITKTDLLLEAYANGFAVWTNGTNGTAATIPPIILSTTTKTAGTQTKFNPVRGPNPISYGWTSGNGTTNAGTFILQLAEGAVPISAQVPVATPVPPVGTLMNAAAAENNNGLGGRWFHFGDWSVTNAITQEQRAILIKNSLRWLYVWRGTRTWERQIGEFMIDRIDESNFPNQIKVTGRDYAKKCLLSKFSKSTTFLKGSVLTVVLRSIAQNAGITKFSYSDTEQLLRSDISFERGVERWKAIVEICNAYELETFFSSDGRHTVRTFRDPVSSPVVLRLRTGALGNLVSFTRSSNDTRVYNHIIVAGENSEENATGNLIWAEAINTESTSPTRISKMGDRSYFYVSPFFTANEQAQAVADAWLKIKALEEYSLDFSSLVFPWLEAGEIVQFTDPNAADTTPRRYLFDTFTIPLGIEPMTGTAKRVTIVGVGTDDNVDEDDDDGGPVVSTAEIRLHDAEVQIASPNVVTSTAEIRLIDASVSLATSSGGGTDPGNFIMGINLFSGSQWTWTTSETAPQVLARQTAAMGKRPGIAKTYISGILPAAFGTPESLMTSKRVIVCTKHNQATLANTTDYDDNITTYTRTIPSDWYVILVNWQEPDNDMLGSGASFTPDTHRRATNHYADVVRADIAAGNTTAKVEVWDNFQYTSVRFGTKGVFWSDTWVADRAHGFSWDTYVNPPPGERIDPTKQTVQPLTGSNYGLDPGTPIAQTPTQFVLNMQTIAARVGFGGNWGVMEIGAPYRQDDRLAVTTRTTGIKRAEWFDVFFDQLINHSTAKFGCIFDARGTGFDQRLIQYDHLGGKTLQLGPTGQNWDPVTHPNPDHEPSFDTLRTYFMAGA